MEARAIDFLTRLIDSKMVTINGIVPPDTSRTTCRFGPDGHDLKDTHTLRGIYGDDIIITLDSICELNHPILMQNMMDVVIPLLTMVRSHLYINIK